MKKDLDRESRSCPLSPRGRRRLSHPTKTSPHGQASLRGNLRSRPGLFPFPRVRRDGQDVSALTMDSTHPIAIARAVLSFDRLAFSFSLPPFARDFLDPFFVALFPLSPTRGAECQFSVARSRPTLRELKNKGGEKDKKHPRISPACYLNAVGGAQRLSSRIAENSAIEFKSASPLGKMIRFALIRRFRLTRHSLLMER